jgi:predicted RNA binding protein with dsRBD fold (UPF0201 family)
MVQAEVHRTEDSVKVQIAVLNLFPNLHVSAEEQGSTSRMVASGEGRESLSELRALISQERIVDSARRVLRKNAKGESVVFYLNKQVATVKHLSFSEPEGESPFGPIAVAIESDRLEEVIDWLAPRTLGPQSRRGTSRDMKSSARTIPGKMRRARSR